jgi:MGT family glycosyltransferase
MEPFREDVEAAGATFRGYEDLLGADAAHFDPDILKSPTIAELAAIVAATCETLLPPLLDVLAREKPDYVVRDLMALWAHYAAQKRNLPTIATIPIFPMSGKQRVQLPFDLLMQGLRTLPQDIPTYLQFWRTTRRLQSTYDLDRLRLGDIFTNREALNIVFTSRYFHPNPEAFDDNFVFVGPAIATRPTREQGEAGIDLQACPGPLLYISLGTVFGDNPDFFKTCFEAFGGTKASPTLTVIVSTGKLLKAETLGSIPDNFIVRSFVTQLEVLRHADVFITHGGMNSASEGLAYGVPLIMAPQAADQFFVTRRVVEMGAGRMLPQRNLTPNDLRQAVRETLADDAMRRQCEAIADSFRKAGGHRRAADAILAYAASKSATRTSRLSAGDHRATAEKRSTRGT